MHRTCTTGLGLAQVNVDGPNDGKEPLEDRQSNKGMKHGNGIRDAELAFDTLTGVERLTAHLVQAMRDASDPRSGLRVAAESARSAVGLCDLPA